MVIPEIAKWAGFKGIDLIGTGDFTHPLWFSELEKNLTPLNSGLYTYKNTQKLKFILTSEISSIYTQGGRVRKVHNLIIAPSLKAVSELNKNLQKIGNIHSDGRPILGISSKNLAKLIFKIDPNFMMIPAHAWTPWFSVFGSKSGFDSLEECFQELTPKIHAIETGLSSDPEMNWQVFKLDPITLISCSDAHSPANLGREATVFEIADSTEISYTLITELIKSAKFASRSAKSVLTNTLEFFPEEGMYHFDGHRNCGNLSMHPDKSKLLGKICPRCKKEMTIGVLSRVCDLADKKNRTKPDNFPSSIHLVPLQEIIAESFGVGKASKKVQNKYLQIVSEIGNEFDILLYKSIDELKNSLDYKIIDGIRRVREGKVEAVPGYDGVYGSIKVFGGDFEKI